MAVIVDSGGNVLLSPGRSIDALARAAIGVRDPRLRVVRALPMQSVEILRPGVVSTLTGNSEAVIASPRVYVHRMVQASRD